jgi:protein O-GlcNAc transferase
MLEPDVIASGELTQPSHSNFASVGETKDQGGPARMGVGRGMCRSRRVPATIGSILRSASPQVSRTLQRSPPSGRKSSTGTGTLARGLPQPHARPIGALQAFQQAASLHAQGRLWEAEQLYKTVLRADQRHFGALCRMGVIRLQQSRFDDAAGLFRRALKVDKSSADAHQCLAFALTGLERFQEAVRHYETALAIRPDFAEACNNLGHALHRLGRFEEAIGQYEKALALSPTYAEAHNNLGNALHLLGRNDAAIAHYERSIAIRPDYAEAYWNLGNAVRALGQFQEAIAHYQKALAIRPNYPEAYNAIGNALRMLARSEDAIVHYEKALAIRPNYADAHVNLGAALGVIGRHEDAIARYDKALAIRPEDADALSKRGDTLAKLKRYDEAMASYERALAADPDQAQAFNGLADAARTACNWARAAKLYPEAVRRVTAGKLVQPFAFLGYCDDPSLQLTCARNFAAHEIPVVPPRFFDGGIWQNQRIRVAYLSADFAVHPTAYLIAELFELQDRSRFEVLGFSFGADDRSDIRARIIRGFDQFHDIRFENDREAAKLINDLQVDIVVDLSAYTAGCRPGILACRPAPIQVSYLVFPGTMGVDHIDYLIADPIVLPFDQQKFYTENIVRLPDCYQVNDAKRLIAQSPTRRELGLPDDGFVFCCFNNNSKLTAPVFDIWMRLLQRTEGSVLWLLRGSADAERNLRKEAAARGIDPARLVFADRVELDQHLARHRAADLFLDTLPYNAHTTASDALWAGLPLVTCYGKAFPGRVAASLLQAIGLPELVTRSLEEYEALALRLASDPSLLRGLREKLNENRLAHPLFDTDRFRRHIEAAYTRMWELWQHGEAPCSFTVEPAPR